MIDQEIYDLIAHFDRSGLSQLKLSTQKFTLELARSGQQNAAGAPAVSPEVPEEPVFEEHVISAPLVGTFYTAPAPDQAAFVSVGDRVKQGQTVCLLEAMKMMSEIPAPCDCVIQEVLKENGELAEYGAPLFRFAPC